MAAKRWILRSCAALLLVATSAASITSASAVSGDTAKVEITVLYDAFGKDHCTGEPAFAALKKAFGDRYLYAGLGTRLTVPVATSSPPRSTSE